MLLRKEDTLDVLQVDDGDLDVVLPPEACVFVERLPFLEGGADGVEAHPHVRGEFMSVANHDAVQLAAFEVEVAGGETSVGALIIIPPTQNRSQAPSRLA